jgi:hypothetical protein
MALRSASSGISKSMINDAHLTEFMDKLAADQRGKNALNLNEWESNFLATYTHLPTNGFIFTPGRRQAIDRMWRKYGEELGHRHPLEAVTERQELPQAEADGCQYIVREDSRQQPCNLPADYQEPGRLRYCKMHGEAVVKALARKGKTLRLIKYP